MNVVKEREDDIQERKNLCDLKTKVTRCKTEPKDNIV